MPLIKAIGLCITSVAIEAISASKEGRVWFERLKRPKYSFSLRVWYAVGAVYHILFGIISYRVFASGVSLSSGPVILLTLVMLINGLSNFVAFKFRSMKWFYFIIYPFALLLLWLIVVLYPTDRTSAFLASFYFLWLIYDLYYGYNMWKLNNK